MRTGLIIALVCVNVGLLLALVLGTTVPPAQAQVVGGGTDYLMLTGKMRGTNAEALFVLDLARRKMVAFKFDITANKLVPMKGRLLIQDFQRKDLAAGPR